MIHAIGGQSAHTPTNRQTARFAGEHTPESTEKQPPQTPPAKPKASAWDWFVRGGVALTMLFSAVTATAAVVIQQQVNSVVQRVPSQDEIDHYKSLIPTQEEIDEIREKVESRLDALPTAEEIEEYKAEIRQLQTDIETFRQVAEEFGFLDSGDPNQGPTLRSQLEDLSRQLTFLQLLLGGGR